MCKIIPSPAALSIQTEKESTQDFDTINKELSIRSGCDEQQQYPFEMDVKLPHSDHYSPFAMESSFMPSPNSSVLSDFLPHTPPFTILPAPKISVQYVSRPAKANNVKRSTPDDPITEEVALKRQKQNEAARKCREKRSSKLQECEKRVEETEKEKFELSVRVAVLEKEAWILKEQEMNLRIEKLRAQLDQSRRV
jgi:Basic region leucine zipper